MTNMLMTIAIVVILTVGLQVAPGQANAAEKSTEAKASAKSIYDFTVKDIDGEDVKLSKYKGDVLLIVNVASR